MCLLGTHAWNHGNTNMVASPILKFPIRISPPLMRRMVVFKASNKRHQAAVSLCCFMDQSVAVALKIFQKLPLMPIFRYYSFHQRRFPPCYELVNQRMYRTRYILLCPISNRQNNTLESEDRVQG